MNSLSCINYELRTRSHVEGYLDAHLIVIFAVAATLAIGELFPAIPVKLSRLARWSINFGTGIISTGVSAAMLYAASSLVDGSGQIKLTIGCPVLRFFLLLTVYDFMLWYWHRLNHEVPVLWRWHRFHHLDPELDASSAWRFHPVELLLSSLWRIPLAIFFAWSITEWEWAAAIATSLTVFHHARFRLPKYADDIVSLILVTPHWHHRHHNPIMKFNNSHYGVIFSFWDRLFGTTASDPSGFPIGLDKSQPSDGISWKKLIG